MRGARAAEVAGKITRHLASFHAFLAAGLGHDRLSAVTPRKVAAWREHLAATVVRTLADGRAQAMAPATVNNHLAHLSAFFTWTAAHAPAGLLPHGDPTARVQLLRLPAPEPRALSAAQVRTLKNVLDRLDGFHRRTDPPPGDTVVVCGPKSAAIGAALMTRDPALEMTESGGRWLIQDRRAEQMIGSPADEDPPQNTDIAYLARHEFDGRIVVHIAGIHAIGSLGAALYLTSHLAELFTQTGEHPFSAVIRASFDGLTITGSELAAGPYPW